MPMQSRRQAREWAVQILFQLDFNPAELQATLDTFWPDPAPRDKKRAFTRELVEGVLAHKSEIDALIRRQAENWDLDRMGAVERNALRLGVFEMLYRKDIPPVVTINEAVSTVKALSDDNAGRFVNGILDRFRKTLKRPARTAAPAE